jgi:hypothetical protein
MTQQEQQNLTMIQWSIANDRAGVAQRRGDWQEAERLREVARALWERLTVART